MEKHQRDAGQTAYRNKSQNVLTVNISWIYMKENLNPRKSLNIFFHMMQMTFEVRKYKRVRQEEFCGR